MKIWPGGQGEYGKIKIWKWAIFWPSLTPWRPSQTFMSQNGLYRCLCPVTTSFMFNSQFLWYLRSSKVILDKKTNFRGNSHILIFPNPPTLQVNLYGSKRFEQVSCIVLYVLYWACTLRGCFKPSKVSLGKTIIQLLIAQLWLEKKPKYGQIHEKRQFLFRALVYFFKNSLRSLVIMSRGGP